ncbi:MAG: tetratricopeptide repeat protein, partial [Nitrospirota bacterium]|nr:tetratricopeptide repeat protein [Nitrospirota bacterium]
RKAIEAYEEACRLDPDDFSSWVLLGRLQQQAGQLRAAEQAYQQALAAAERAGDERDIGVAYHELGEIRQAAGDLAGALEAYQRHHSAAQDPRNAGWQRDLSVSHEKIGDVRVAQGDLAGALDAYGESLAIRERLASQDPGNAEWQRDLIVSNVKMAEVATGDEGRTAEARGHYEAALAIATDLHESGRLAPRDAWMVEDFESRLAGLSE